MMPIRLLIADDHLLVRSGFRALLQQLPDVEIVAEAANGREALQRAREHEPDVVLMDIAMPELNGLQATARLKNEMPEVRVIMLSMHANEEYLSEALAVGAAGYLLKDAAPVELGLALRAVAAGKTFLSPAVEKRLASGRTGPGRDRPSGLGLLTPRQREVLQLIAEGNSTRAIATKLRLSVKTVETHRANLMKRLDIHDVPGLVRFAIRAGLVDPEH